MKRLTGNLLLNGLLVAVIALVAYGTLVPLVQASSEIFQEGGRTLHNNHCDNNANNNENVNDNLNANISGLNNKIYLGSVMLIRHLCDDNTNANSNDNGNANENDNTNENDNDNVNANENDNTNTNDNENDNLNANVNGNRNSQGR